MVCLYYHSFPRKCHVALSSNVIEWSFQGINTNPLTDPSLRSIKFSLYPKTKQRKTNEKTRIYLKQNSTEITRRLI